ncbi:flagellar basal body P-ring formation chaperone FlgA [uncultured Photobacterium sp.]|uniref:flagellar basal body P-ring formation chaperone FlgA n=1 Tax=uncultured Photobacterium sp. TaxID=173973 RepID=UPI002617C0C7|nr:flagellar basal body P-ring formation chaperone FlgA [uncultured Photobacterium sp.]
MYSKLKRKCHFRAEIVTTLLLLSGLFPAVSLSADTGEKSATEHAVKRFLELQVKRYAASIGSQDYQITLKPLGELPHCDETIRKTLSEPEQPIGRLTVTLECHQPKYWKARTRAEVKVYLPLVVAKRTLSRHQTIAFDDLSLKRSNIAYLRRNYFTSPGDLIGLTSRRKIIAGKIISPKMVESPQLVQRNEEVIIEATLGTMTARMKGIALESGAKGNTIRVRNLSSNKEIFATVTGKQRVKTTF